MTRGWQLHTCAVHTAVHTATARVVARVRRISDTSYRDLVVVSSLPAGKGLNCQWQLTWNCQWQLTWQLNLSLNRVQNLSN